jgi:hypothetical protein
MIPNLSFAEMLFLLFVCHSLADYPLQGPFLSEAKNPRTQLGKMFWPYALSSHATIHGGFVYLVTGSLLLGLLEIVIHALTDWLKCMDKIDMLVDQLIHYACKVVWVVVFFTWLRPA